MWVVFNNFINSAITRFVTLKGITFNHRIKSKQHKQRYPSFTHKLQNGKLYCWHTYKFKHDITSKELYNMAVSHLKTAIFNHHLLIGEKIISSRNDGAFYNHLHKKLCCKEGIGTLWEVNGSIVNSTQEETDVLNAHFSNVWINDDGQKPVCCSLVDAQTF